MTRQTSIRLPARLVGVRPSEPNAPALPAPHCVPAPLPSPPAQHEGARTQEEQAQIKQLLVKLTNTVDQMHSMTRLALDQMRTTTVDLALAVTSRFLMQEVQAGRFPFETLVEQALDQLAVRQPVTIFLNPEDLALLQTRLQEEGHPATDSTPRWLASAFLPRGAFRIEGPDRSVLFDLKERIEKMRQVLVQTTESEPTSTLSQ